MLKKIIKKIWQGLRPSSRLKIIRITQKKFTVSVAAIIINDSKEVLLLNHVFRAGLSWGIPGGFVEAGEQPERAIRREIREETGLELANIELIRLRTHNQHIEILFSASPVGTARAQSFEINDLGWFEANEMPEQMNQVQKQIVWDALNSTCKILID